MHLETASGDVIRIINLKNKFVEMGGDGGGQKEGKFWGHVIAKDENIRLRK